MSERRELAERLAAIIREHGMTSPFGGDVEQSNDRRHYGILFSRPATLDGLVEVFSPKFIHIQAQGRAVSGGLDGVYETEERAALVLRSIAEGNMDRAWQVPARPRRPAQPQQQPRRR